MHIWQLEEMIPISNFTEYNRNKTAPYWLSS